MPRKNKKFTEQEKEIYDRGHRDGKAGKTRRNKNLTEQEKDIYRLGFMASVEI